MFERWTASPKRIQWLVLCMIVILLAAALAQAGALIMARETGRAVPSTENEQRPALDRTGELWEPIEWSLQNNSYAGNPFDLVAEVTFVHVASGENRRTSMFYAGDRSWRFRFTGTQIGTWTFSTQSDDPDLNAHSGTVTVIPNADPKATGFLTHAGNRFAVPVGANGELQGFLLNIDGGDGAAPMPIRALTEDPETQAAQVVQMAKQHGMSAVSLLLAHALFQLDAGTAPEHNSEEPDLRAFAVLEQALAVMRSEGIRVHLVMWGDEVRQWTPTGLPGGINGATDRRMQRYIAARLGPLPGWTMTYGLDPSAWATEDHVRAWAAYLHEQMGWSHLLMASPFTAAELDAVAREEWPAADFYQDAMVQLQKAKARPVLYTQGAVYGRDNPWALDTIRRAQWQMAMAGGAGGWWVFPRFGNEGAAAEHYVAQAKTFAAFWEKRFLLTLQPAMVEPGGFVLVDTEHRHAIFYQENTSEVPITLLNRAGLPAIAVDTRKAYTEINLGILGPENPVWHAPYSSDWAIAVGSFPGIPAPVATPLPTATASPTLTPIPTATVTATMTPTPAAPPTPATLPTPPTPDSRCPAPSGDLIVGLKGRGGRGYEIGQLANGQRTYTDRRYEITSVPEWLQGSLFIRTANDDKNRRHREQLRFTLTADAIVYVAFDARARQLPSWLNEGWTPVGAEIGTTDVSLSLYEKPFECGPVVLGGNAMAPMRGANTNYIVIVSTPPAEQMGHYFLPLFQR